MKFREEIYATGIQCLRGVLLFSLAVAVFIAVHQILWDWICISAKFIFYGTGDLLVFMFPILPALCFILMAFIIWLGCLTAKLSNMNKLEKEFWKKSMIAHVASLLLLIFFFSAWLSISNSGETMLKGVGWFGLVVSILCTMVIAMAYDEQMIKPENCKE